jgi:hypothetical protein
MEYTWAQGNDFAAVAAMMETDPTAERFEPESSSMTREEIEALYGGTKSQKAAVSRGS